MTVTIYKPNIDVIRQQAEQAREAEKRRQESNDLRWIDIELGDNTLRLLPPTNSRGMIFKKVCSHYFNDTVFKGKIEKQRCLVQTHDDIPNISCPICDIGDRILAQRPDMKIDRWHRPGASYFGQAISRKDEEQIPLAKLVRCTTGVKNWVVQQVELAWGQGVDITDFNAGIDINIVKEEKPSKRGPRTYYKPAIASLMGPTPVLSNLPEGVTLDQAIGHIVESMYDLDTIWKIPDDEAIAGINKAAADIYSYYTKEAYSHPGASVQVPGTYAPLPPQQQSSAPQPVPHASAQNFENTPENAAKAIAAVATHPVQSSPQPQMENTPQDRPACWGGASPREDGGTGYDDESEFCLMCPHEMTCMDACK